MKHRYALIYLLIPAIIAAIITRLVDLQIINGKEYTQKSEQRLFKTYAVKAPRGDIYDRYGNLLARDKRALGVVINYNAERTTDQLNQMMVSLWRLFDDYEIAPTDTLPISQDGESFVFRGDAEQAEKSERTWKKEQNLPADATAAEALDKLAERFRVAEDYSTINKRIAVGQRYEMKLANFSSRAPYSFAEGITMELVTQLRENFIEYPDVSIINVPLREYSNDGLATHVLGRVDKIYQEEYSVLKDKGYNMKDIVGKQALEKYLEDYLRGTDGLSTIETNATSYEINVIASKEPVPGDNAILTLDFDLQRITEQALKDTIAEIRQNSRYERNRAGYDAQCGAAVVIDVNSGEILAIASYPSYDGTRFNEIYDKLLNDKNRPMLNRAISGAYEPGSTFKMCTALAGMDSGFITPGAAVTCTGVYQFAPSYNPKCNSRHGAISMSSAISRSCNYYFYDLGNKTTIERMNEYSLKLGLGVLCGIEIPGEETAGILAGKEYRKKIDQIWHPGDTLQAAIGQSDNLFTPLQLANYVATLANGGTRYRPHLVKSIRSGVDGNVVMENQPEILDEIKIKSAHHKAIMEGMLSVTQSGTAARTFAGADFVSAGKTGTSEVPSGSDNGIFVGFAPYDKPEIAVSVVVEHGAHGDSVAPVARKIFEGYLHRTVESDPILEIGSVY